MKSTFAIVSMITAAAGCGGGSSSSHTSYAEPVIPPPGPALAEVLPAELPNQVRCLAITPTGDGALVVTPFPQSGDDPPGGVRLELLMLSGATPPLDLGEAVFASGDEDSWTARRGELEPQLVALGMVECVQQVFDERLGPVVVMYGHNTLSFSTTWEDGEVDPLALPDDADAEDIMDAAPDRVGNIVMRYLSDGNQYTPIVSAASESGVHQDLAMIYSNRWAPAVVVVIRNTTDGVLTWEYDVDDQATLLEPPGPY